MLTVRECDPVPPIDETFNEEWMGRVVIELWGP
jgi:hypothetical protein